MRREILNCTCAVAMLAMAGCAGNPPHRDDTGELYSLDGPPPYKFDCSVENGYFRVVHLPTVGAHLRVTGTIHVLTMHPTPTGWGSTALIGLMDQKQKFGSDFQLVVAPFAPDRIKMTILGVGGSNSQTVFASRPNTESNIPFMLEVDGGFFAVSVGDGIVAKAKVPKPGLTRVVLGCSGAHVQFTNIVATDGQ